MKSLGGTKHDWVPLLAVEHIHKDRYSTMKILEALFNNFESVFPHLSRNEQFLGRCYIEDMIIQVTCQYVEDVGRYSVTCKETGLLYVERMISVASGEIGHFYSSVNKLTDDDIRKIFKLYPSEGRMPLFDFSEIREKYRKLKEFRNKYQGLYNAIKHGNQVLRHEISTKDKPMNSMHGTYINFQWIVRGKQRKVEVKTWDGSKTEIMVTDRKQRGVLLPSDDIVEFVRTAEDCYTIIELILTHHNPNFLL